MSGTEHTNCVGPFEQYDLVRQPPKCELEPKTPTPQGPDLVIREILGSKRAKAGDQDPQGDFVDNCAYDQAANDPLEHKARPSCRSSMPEGSCR